MKVIVLYIFFRSKPEIKGKKDLLNCPKNHFRCYQAYKVTRCFRICSSPSLLQSFERKCCVAFVKLVQMFSDSLPCNDFTFSRGSHIVETLKERTQQADNFELRVLSRSSLTCHQITNVAIHFIKDIVQSFIT